MTTRAELAALIYAITDDWHKGALCAQTDPELFFPEKGAGLNVALAICHRCPVRLDCLETALRDNEMHGVWGGMSEHQRRLLRRERRRRQHWESGKTP